jgi:hypothetical protein
MTTVSAERVGVGPWRVFSSAFKQSLAMLAGVRGIFGGNGASPVGDSAWLELERRKGGYGAETPFAECNEFIDAFRCKFGVEGFCIRLFGPAEGLREGTRRRGAGDWDERREGGPRGVLGSSRSGDFGAGSWDIESFSRDRARSLSSGGAVLVFAVVVSSLEGCGASLVDAMMCSSQRRS